MSTQSHPVHDSIVVGDVIPPLQRTITLVDMVAYAGATWDWYKSHYDPAFVEAAKLPAPMVDGQVFGALLVEQLQDWLGADSFVRELSFTFKNLVFAGETVRCEGTVTEIAEIDGVAEIAGGGVRQLSADLRVVVVAEDGTEDRLAAGGARAVVLLGVADGPGAA